MKVWVVDYTTFMGGAESCACKRFETKSDAEAFAKQVKGVVREVV
jgi:hypothetical protein